MWKVLKVKDGIMEESLFELAMDGNAFIVAEAAQPTRWNETYSRVEDADGASWYLIDMHGVGGLKEDQAVPDRRSYNRGPTDFGVMYLGTAPELRGCPLERYFLSLLERPKRRGRSVPEEGSDE